MKLRLKNVGRIITEAEIDINGITVLAGKNGTGKSTIGKALYCTFNSFHDYDEKIVKERENSIFRLVRIISSNRTITRLGIQNLRKSIRELIDTYSFEKNDDKIREYLLDVVGETKEDLDGELFSRIRGVLNADDTEILKAILSRSIEAEFGSQLGHVNYRDNESRIELELKNEKISYSFKADESINISEKIRLIKDVIYIDDPYILDNMQNGYFFDRNMGHVNNLVNKLRKIELKETSAVDDVITDNRLKSIYARFDSISVGNLINNSEKGFSYSDSGLKEDMSIVNISTGIKSFVILKTLLQNGYLEENGIVILDEPETHLNPDWMLIYAEIVVSLHELFGINFLISTHNSEFLSFIEFFTRKYNVDSKAKYYWLKQNEKDSLVTDIEDVSDKLEVIYSNLSRSFLRISEELDCINENK